MIAGAVDFAEFLLVCALCLMAVGVTLSGLALISIYRDKKRAG